MDTWNPDQYQRFQAERRQPFDELVDRCDPVLGGLVYDLGCGPGNLTAELPFRLGADLVVGVDSSPAMLAKARAHTSEHVRFEEGDLANLFADHRVDLVFANAALQWVDRHHEVLAHWRSALKPGGQLAFQIPSNGDHPAYRAISELSGDLADWFPGGRAVGPVSDNVAQPEAYARWLWRLGPDDLWVTQRVFTHVFDDRSSVLEWLKGTSLTRVEAALGDEDRYASYLEMYAHRLDGVLPDEQPFLFTFKRILAWARFP